MFEYLKGYSPLHNLKKGTKYPATLVTTADHDDRVFPAHSFKFAATLQAAQAGDAPVLIRIETRAGHGAGKPTDKAIEEGADIKKEYYVSLVTDRATQKVAFIASTLIVAATLSFPEVVLLESGLSFLGLGGATGKVISSCRVPLLLAH